MIRVESYIVMVYNNNNNQMNKTQLVLKFSKIFLFHLEQNILKIINLNSNIITKGFDSFIV